MIKEARRKRRFMVKLDPNRTGKTVDHDAHARGVGFNRRLFTRRVRGLSSI